LIGLASSRTMCERVQEFSQFPGAPNLYWALTLLPRPIIDLRDAIQVEGSFMYLMFPVLRDPEMADRTPDQWRELVLEMLRKMNGDELDESEPKRRMSDETRMALVLKGFPMAKEYLISKGHPATKIEKMPIGQVAAIYTAVRYDELRDEMIKWTFIACSESA